MTTRPAAPPRGRRRGPARVVGIVALGVVECGLVALFVVRGLGYGVFVAGPYADAWGGPSLAGAWAVHAAIGFGLAAAGAVGLAVLVRRR